MSSNTLARALATASLAGAFLLAGCAGVSATTGPSSRSDDRFSHIHAGMTGDEVRQLLGTPDETMKFPLSQNVAWDYRYQDDWGYMAVYSVTFGSDGRAVSTLSRRINVGGDHR